MLRNISISFVTSITIQLVTMLGGILSARLLLPEGKGELTAIMLWPSLLASIGSLGVIDAVAYFSAKNPKDSPKVLASAMVLTLGLAAGLAGIGYLILPLVLSGYGVSLVDTARMYLTYIPLSLAALSLMALMLGRMRLLEYNVLRAFVQVSFPVGILLLYVFGQVSVQRLAELSLVANLATLVMAAALVSRHSWLIWQPSISTMKTLLGYGLKVHLASVASFFNLRLDQIIMSIFLQPTVLGLYVAAVTVSAGASIAASTVGLVAFPSIVNRRSPQARAHAFGRFMRLAILLSLIAAIGLWWLTPWILGFFLGVAYLPATWPARILILASIPLGSNMLFSAGFKAFNHPLVLGKAELVSLVATAVSLSVLLPRYGAVGAACASLLAYSACWVFFAYSLERELGISVVHLFLPTVDDRAYVAQRLTFLGAQMSGARKWIGWSR